MIKITAQQRANQLEALNVMWPSVPAKNVYSNLTRWREQNYSIKKVDCDTLACFGGWCSLYPKFIAQGIYADDYGIPCMGDASGTEVAGNFFGDGALFLPRSVYELGTDHQVVTTRLKKLIRYSVVV